MESTTADSMNDKIDMYSAKQSMNDNINTDSTTAESMNYTSDRTNILSSYAY
jgi:hypothetical protein